MRRLIPALFALASLSAVLGGLFAPVGRTQTSAPGHVVIHVTNNVIDPGPRGGSPGAGGPLTGLGADELAFFTAAQARFEEVDSVTGSVGGEPGAGLGPRFNLNSCAGCHAFPVAGGTSPAVNPQVAMATDAGATNVVPSFITSNGPTREARFVMSGSTYDGSVHPLFVITGRSDAPGGCTMTQPNFTAQLTANNVIFRIPTPLFGLGLVEATPDANLVAAQNPTLMTSLSIMPHNFNLSGNDSTITRFGWKAQNKSLLMFAGEAYNVEMGVTNELFPNERQLDQPACAANPQSEDSTNLTNTVNSGSLASDFSSDIVNFAAFARLLAPPTPVTSYGSVMNASITNGQAQFNAVGCVACHVQHQTTGDSRMTGQSNLTYSPFSDFALHGMGVNLADRIVQGFSNGDVFRTAPLWGAGQRLFLMHDGRTSDLLQAIMLHSSPGSEANRVILNFENLSSSDQQDLLNFLRSL